MNYIYLVHSYDTMSGDELATQGAINSQPLAQVNRDIMGAFQYKDRLSQVWIRMSKIRRSRDI